MPGDSRAGWDQHWLWDGGNGEEERANVCIKISRCNERQKETRVVRASMCCERASVAGRGPGSIHGARVWALEGASLPFPPMDH